MNQETKNPIDRQLLLIEKLRRQLVSDVLEKTDLLPGDFTIDISVSFADDASHDFYKAAKRLGWQHDKKDGETVVFGVSNRGEPDNESRSI